MNTYLQQYIKHCEEFYKDSFMILLDTDLIAHFAGSKYLEVVKRPIEMVLGRHIHDTTNVPEENKPPSLKAFAKAIKYNKVIPAVIADILNEIDGGIMIFGSTIYPVVDPSNQEVIALRFEFYPINLQMFFTAVIKNVDHINENNLPDNDEFLTRREHQIAFLLFYCNDYNEIAKLISIYSNKTVTEKTVRNIVSQYLYPKFNVSSRTNLLDKLREHGYDKKMPNSLLTNRYIDMSR